MTAALCAGGFQPQHYSSHVRALDVTALSLTAIGGSQPGTQLLYAKSWDLRAASWNSSAASAASVGLSTGHCRPLLLVTIGLWWSLQVSFGC